jgi:hypothetical protein
MDFFKPEVKKIQYNHILSESGEKEPSNELFFRSESSIGEKLEVCFIINLLISHR